MFETVAETGAAWKSKSIMPNTNHDISLSSIIVCADGNLSCDLREEAVLLNLQSGTYFGLNPLGARVWELIQRPAKVSFIKDELLREYNVDADQCEADLLSFLKQLQSHELVKVQGSNDG